MVVGYKTVNIKNSTITAGVSNMFFKKFDVAGEHYEIKATADAKGSKVTIQNSVFGSEEAGKTEVARMVVGNTIILKNVSGSLGTLLATDYNDKIEITASSFTINVFGKSSLPPPDDIASAPGAGNDATAEPPSPQAVNPAIILGAGNDTLKIGNNSTINVMQMIGFGEGSDTLTVGKNCTVTLKSDAKGLGKFTIGSGSTAYLSSELIAKISKAGDFTVVDLGAVDTAVNFTTLNDEQSDNSYPTARSIKDRTYDGWLNDKLDTTDYFNIDSWTSMNLETDDKLTIELWGETGKLGTLTDKKEVTFADYEGATRFAIITNKDADGSCRYKLSMVSETP